MADVSIIHLSDLKSNRRLDPQYYHTANIALDTTLDKVETDTLDDVTSLITDGIHASIQFDDDSDVLLVSAMSPKQNYFDVSKNRHIDVLQHDKNPRTSLRIEDVIISTVGTIGNVAVVTDDMLPANSDRHVGIIRLNDDILPRYVTTFLLSKYGRYQVMRETTGNVQPNLFIDKIETLKIPKVSKPFQQLVEDMVMRANHLRTEALEVYRQATYELEDTLGLVNLKYDMANISERYLSEYVSTSRLDPEYWLPRYDSHLEQLKTFKHDSLGNIADYIKGVEVGSEEYADDGIPFVRVSDFSHLGIEPKVEKKISNELYLELKDKQAQKGEVLLTKDGTIGIAFALKNSGEFILSGAFLRLCIKEGSGVNAEYLSLVLNSSVGRTQMKRLTGGAIIGHLKPEDAMSLCIPILDDAYQKKVEKVLGKVFIDLHQSRVLLHTVIESMDRLVEHGQEDAHQFLIAAAASPALDKT